VVRRLIPVAAVVTLLAVSAGCGDDEPEVCGSLRDLQTSVQSLRDIELTDTSAEELREAADEVATDVESVENDADEEFGQEVDTFQATVQTLVDDVETATAGGELTRDSVAELATAVASAATAFETLKDAAPDCDLE
jgi:prophage DNA circulation protein